MDTNAQDRTENSFVFLLVHQFEMRALAFSLSFAVDGDVLCRSFVPSVFSFIAFKLVVSHVPYVYDYR